MRKTVRCALGLVAKLRDRPIDQRYLRSSMRTICGTRAYPPPMRRRRYSPDTSAAASLLLPSLAVSSLALIIIFRFRQFGRYPLLRRNVTHTRDTGCLTVAQLLPVRCSDTSKNIKQITRLQISQNKNLPLY